MSDERYDRSADMRLLDLQREAMGAQPHMLPATIYIDPDPLTADSPDDFVLESSGTILVPQLAAQPSTNLIAGALVTVSLAIANDGNTIAKNVRARISLPGDTVYRAGSMTIDGIAADDDWANDFFANGTDLGDILPAARRTLVVKVMIEAGPTDIILSPHVSAASGAIYGARTTRLTRAKLSRPHIAADLPFYESDDGEPVVEPLSPRTPERVVGPQYLRILPSAPKDTPLMSPHQGRASMPTLQQNSSQVPPPQVPPLQHSPPQVPPLQQSPPQVPPLQESLPQVPQLQHSPPQVPPLQQSPPQVPPLQESLPQAPPLQESPPQAPPLEQSPPQAPLLPQSSPQVPPLTESASEPVLSTVARPFTQRITSPAVPGISTTPGPTLTDYAEQIATKVVVPSIRGGTQKPSRKPTAQTAPNSRDSIEPSAVTSLQEKVAEPTTAPAATPPSSKPKPEPKGAKAKQIDGSIAAPASSRKSATPKPRTTVVQPAAAAERPAATIAGDLQLAGKGGPILTVRIDRNRLATLARLFKGPSLGMIAHYLVLNALAATDALPGDGNDRTLAAFVKEQERLLSRALITARLGKTPASETVAAILPAFPPAIAGRTSSATISHSLASEVLLVRAFQTNEIVFLERMLSNQNAPPFLRAAQLFVGLCGNDVVVASRRDHCPVSEQLTAYATLATTEISRMFLRAKLTRTPDLFKSTESSFDDAARTVLHELETLIT